MKQVMQRPIIRIPEKKGTITARIDSIIALSVSP